MISIGRNPLGRGGFGVLFDEKGLKPDHGMDLGSQGLGMLRAKVPSPPSAKGQGPGRVSLVFKGYIDVIQI